MKKIITMLLVVVMVAAMFATAALAAPKMPEKPVEDEFIDAINEGKENENKKSKGIFDGVFNLIKKSLQGKKFVIKSSEKEAEPVVIPGDLIADVLNKVQYIVDRLAFGERSWRNSPFSEKK